LIFIEPDPDDPTVFVVATGPDEHTIDVIPTLQALLWWTVGPFEPQQRIPARRRL
jgi:hypothetical protein